MKKQIAIWLVLALLAGMCGCAAVPEEPAEQTVSGTETENGKQTEPALTETEKAEHSETEEPVPQPAEQPEETEAQISSDGRNAGSFEVSEGYLCSSNLEVYSVSTELPIRSGSKVGDTGELAADEYWSIVLRLENRGREPMNWQEVCVRVDGGEAWYWAAGSLPAKSSTSFHVFYSNMQKIAEGNHTVTWYMDGEELHSDTFLLTHDLDWETLTDLPDRAQIDACNEAASMRSPYMAVWLNIPNDANYTEYTVDFKSDHFPPGSYYSIGNWYMDYPMLEQQYEEVWTEYGISGYAGVQHIYNGEKIAIISGWDVFCKDAAGNVTTVRTQRLYPKDSYQGGEFGGEGTGIQCLERYEWKEDHWYRARLSCNETAENGNTVVSYRLQDLETGEETLICSYDLGTQNAVFRGSMCVFLENYLTQYAGELRTFEVCNARYLDAADGVWKKISEGDMIPFGGAISMDYAGSYDYGVEDGRLWIMTTGVGNTCDDGSGTHLVLEP